MESYKQLLSDILQHGEKRNDRTGTGTISIFGHQWRHHMGNGFPLLTTKKVHFKSIIHELIWFLNGDTNVGYLQDNGVSIWNEWANPSGELGPVYGHQWRRWSNYRDTWKPIDQIGNLVKDIRDNPDSRRMIVTAWNPSDVPYMALPPCHSFWQCNVSKHGRELNLHLYARSIDAFLGLPFNIASYALLLRVLANVTKKNPGELIISFGDLHIYQNHLTQVNEQLGRAPTELPRVKLGRLLDKPEDLKFDDVEIYNYHPQAAIPAKVAV